MKLLTILDYIFCMLLFGYVGVTLWTILNYPQLLAEPLIITINLLVLLLVVSYSIGLFQTGDKDV